MIIIFIYSKNFDIFDIFEFYNERKDNVSVNKSNNLLLILSFIRNQKQMSYTTVLFKKNSNFFNFLSLYQIITFIMNLYDSAHLIQIFVLNYKI
jgi:hypothetical protein